MRAVFSRSYARAVDEIRRESDVLRSGTLNRIDEMKREISMLISEYDEGAAEEREIVNRPNETQVTGDDFEPLSNSVRIIKLKSS